MKKFTWSVDDEDWRAGMFDSFDDAVANAIDNAEDENWRPVESVYIGECKEHPNSRFFPDGGVIIDHMQCAADDIGGEHGCDYPDVDREAISDLTNMLHKMLNEWCAKHGVEPSFYEIESSKLVKIR